ncbi:sugar transferase [Sulfurospirillum diekertiae]|uniref:sugar transferase n=1 Tax=Sulfurospirillum diekertiae TaxID=1854492 RepID=UPI00192CEA69
MFYGCKTRYDRTLASKWAHNDIEYDERIQLDVWYVRNWSIELDIQILIKTILVVLSRKGSY